MEQIQDIPKLYTAFAEWLSCLVMLFIYARFIDKKKIKTVILKLFMALGALCVIQTLCGMVSNGLWLAGMLLAVIVMTMTIRNCLDLSWNIAVYCCARAFLLAEMLASLEWQIYYFYFGANGYGRSVFSIVFCFLIYLAGYVIFYYVEVRELPESMEKGQIAVTAKQQFVVCLVAVFIFALSNLSYIEIDTPFTGNGTTEIFNIRTLIDVMGLLILEAFHMQKMDGTRKEEVTAIRNILMSQYAQYRESQENIDMLNRKYHDLKHQLQVIRQESNESKRVEYLDEIEKGLQRFESEIKTGNSVLDTILTSKGSLCIKQDITLKVVADGKLLNHIYVMDLCTIFGNALDNAIEYEVQIADRERRLIHVSVAEKRNFICVVIENYYEGTMHFDGQLPETTKSDKNYHGYGLKSIRYSVNRYDGYMNMGVKDGWFRLELLFPKVSMDVS